jgi:argininosuccinate lyase
MWGGRFAEGPAEAMQRFNACLDDDRKMAMEDIDGSVAHARMLGAVGLIGPEDIDAIVAGLEQIRQEIIDGAFIWDEALEDVHMNVEHRLKAIVGEAAGRLHTARSRNDQVATDMRLWTRKALGRLADGCRDLQVALLEQAQGHEKTAMPGFTHLQIAQPISYAQYCLAYIEMLARDRSRFADAAKRLNECPLGAAALAGTAHPIDRQQTAAALGFDRPARNSLDAVSSRDFVLEALAAATICAGTLSRLAEEIVIFATPQFGYLRVADQYSTGSSIMPQKRNPDAAELLRAKVGKVAGALTATLLATKGLPLAYSKDLQETKGPLFEALETLEGSLDIATRMVASIEPRTDNMARDAAAGFATATDIADRLAARGVPFREAHHIVGRLVAECEARGLTLDTLPAKVARTISPELTPDILADLDAVSSLCRKTSEGGTAPGPVLVQIDHWRAELGLGAR